MESVSLNQLGAPRILDGSLWNQLVHEEVFSHCQYEQSHCD